MAVRRQDYPSPPPSSTAGAGTANFQYGGGGAQQQQQQHDQTASSTTSSRFDPYSPTAGRQMWPSPGGAGNSAPAAPPSTHPSQGYDHQAPVYVQQAMFWNPPSRPQFSFEATTSSAPYLSHQQQQLQQQQPLIQNVGPMLHPEFLGPGGAAAITAAAMGHAHNNPSSRSAKDRPNSFPTKLQMCEETVLRVEEQVREVAASTGVAVVLDDDAAAGTGLGAGGMNGSNGRSSGGSRKRRRTG
jgi:hypothetical protein